jgi:hypothetical protein
MNYQMTIMQARADIPIQLARADAVLFDETLQFRQAADCSLSKFHCFVEE